MFQSVVDDDGKMFSVVVEESYVNDTALADGVEGKALSQLTKDTVQ